MEDSQRKQLKLDYVTVNSKGTWPHDTPEWYVLDVHIKRSSQNKAKQEILVVSQGVWSTEMPWKY